MAKAQVLTLFMPGIGQSTCIKIYFISQFQSLNSGGLEMGQHHVSIQDLEQHLISSYNLDSRDFPRLLEDITGFFDMTLEEFVQLRHRQLKHQGLKNEEIYQRLLKEIEERRFKAPSLSLRLSVPDNRHPRVRPWSPLLSTAR